MQGQHAIDIENRGPDLVEGNGGRDTLKQDK